jgi:serine/threonine protein kinase
MSLSSSTRECELASLTSLSQLEALSKQTKEVLVWRGDPSKVFELVQKVGEGGCGEVFRAHVRNEPDLTLAVKRIELQTSSLSGELQREIDIFRQCHHQHLCKFYGSVISDEALWLIMEVCINIIKKKKKKKKTNSNV